VSAATSHATDTVASMRGQKRSGKTSRISLVASRQIKLLRIDGWRRIAAMLSHHTTVAA